MNTSFSVEMNVNAPDFVASTLDSVVLRMELDEEAHYGDFDATHLVEVFQMTNPYLDELEMIGDENITTFTEFTFDESNLLGQVDFIPKYQDSIDLDLHTIADTTERVPYQLRVKFDDSFGNMFFDDVMNVASDTAYMAAAKGLVIRSTPSTSSMIGLDFSEIASSSLDFYYTKNSGDKFIASFNVAIGNHLNVMHEYEGSGSDVEAALNDTSEDQDLLYIESYSGSNVEFDLSVLSSYQDSIINFASLEVTLAEVPEYDNELFPEIHNLILSRINDDGDLIIIKDIEDLDQKLISDIEDDFGGDARTNALTGEITYTMNITRHVKEAIEGIYGNNTSIILSNAAKSFETNRSIIYGSGNVDKAPKLKLVISEP